MKGARRPYVVFAGGGDLQPLVLERRHLAWLALGASGLTALFIGGVASSQWLLVLQYLEATPFGQADPLIGRDAAFYIFTLPFLDFVRLGLFAVVALALVGSVAGLRGRRRDRSSSRTAFRWASRPGGICCCSAQPSSCCSPGPRTWTCRAC